MRCKVGSEDNPLLLGTGYCNQSIVSSFSNMATPLLGTSGFSIRFLGVWDFEEFDFYKKDCQAQAKPQQSWTDGNFPDSGF